MRIRPQDRTEKHKLFREWVRWQEAICPYCDNGYKQFECICEERQLKKTEIERKLKNLI